ncbi:MAG: 6-phosphogluconolactonase [Chloroflexota bacterium]
MLPTIRTFSNKNELSQAAAALFAACAERAVAENGRFLIALSGGGTPQGLFDLLGQPPLASTLPWAQTHVFWGDERLVPPDATGSNYRQAWNAFLQHVPIPAANIHRAKGELSPEAAAADYEAQLADVAQNGRSYPIFDLCIMGMGGDGHTASLFPGPIPAVENEKPVMAVTAVYQDRPANRVTLTPVVFNAARHVVFLATGESKAEALTAVIHGQPNPEKWPAQRIRPSHGDVTWLVDEAAASFIKS